MEISTIGLDLAKSVFQVHAVDETGKAVLKKTLRRSQLLPFFSKLSPCLVGMEACGTSHHWAREIAALGQQVRLMPPAYVKPYVKRGKTDANDAEAICEAVTRPTMRFVAVKCQKALKIFENACPDLNWEHATSAPLPPRAASIGRQRGGRSTSLLKRAIWFEAVMDR